MDRPEDAFHVVVPSLPGYGFSQRTDATGWGPPPTAKVWAELMTVLGYDTFGAHGGDWGAFVSTELARQFPERVTGLYLTMPVANPCPPTKPRPTKRSNDCCKHDH